MNNKTAGPNSLTHERGKIAEMYASGMTLDEIGKVFDVTAPTIYYHLRAIGTKFRGSGFKNRRPETTGRRYRWTDAQKSQMVSLYEDGWSIADINKEIGGSIASISYHLKRAGVVLRKGSASTPRARAKITGENHGMWKGGKYKAKGYVFVLDRLHPFADSGGYVPEHRLELEKRLRDTDPAHPSMTKEGFLQKDWVVHHKNGVKDDNRPENLEPMTKGQHSLLHNTLGSHHEQVTEHIQRLESLLRENGIAFDHDVSP